MVKWFHLGVNCTESFVSNNWWSETVQSSVSVSDTHVDIQELLHERFLRPEPHSDSQQRCPLSQSPALRLVRLLGFISAEHAGNQYGALRQAPSQCFTGTVRLDVADCSTTKSAGW